MLAIKLHNKDAVLVLSELDSNVHLRPHPFSRTSTEECVEQKNKPMLMSLLRASQRLSKAAWQHDKEKILKAVSLIPDFSCKMGWECDSNYIPFLKRMAPSDQFQIYKKDKNLRIDMTLVGWDKMKSVRGNLSLLFKYDKGEQGSLVIVDHDEKKTNNFFKEVSA